MSAQNMAVDVLLRQLDNMKRKYDHYKVGVPPPPPPPPPPEPKPPKPEPIPKPPAPKCVHEYPKDTQLRTEYDDDLCDLVLEFGRAGNFIQGFCGHYNICTETMNKEWLNREKKEYAKFRSAVKTAQSAVFDFYNKELIHAIQNYEQLGSSVNVIRSILSELMKSTPAALRDLQFEDVNADETPEERSIRLKKENEKRQFEAFRGSNGNSE